jgi:flagellin
MRVNHNIASMTALRHLTNTAEDTAKNLERLSSGLRINSARDSPAELMISENMRARIGSVDQAMRNTETSISMIQTAEGALSEVSSMLINMRQLAVHAANEGANDEQMMRADQNEIENLLATLDRIASSTQFGSKVLFNGSNAAKGVTVGDGFRFVSASEKTQPAPTKEGYPIDILQVGVRARMSGTKPISIENVEKGLTFVINEGKAMMSLNTTEGPLSESLNRLLDNHYRSPDLFTREDVEKGMQQLISRSMNDKAAENGLEVEVYINRAGMLTIRHKLFGSEPSFSVTVNQPEVLTQVADEAQFSEGGRDVAGFIGGEIAIGRGQRLTGAPGTAIEGLTIEYTKELGSRIEEYINPETGELVEVREVLDDNSTLAGAETDGYVHVTQNSLIFQVGPNCEQEEAFSLCSVRSNELAKGVNNESDFRSLADIDVTTQQGASDAICLIDEAINQVSQCRADIGSFQKNSLETNLRNLRVHNENLTSAESTIRDADMASEMSDFTKNQILLASGTAMTAQANQIPRSVLQLISAQ